MDDDEFGLSSSDEAELLRLEPIVTNNKRKNERDDLSNTSKKLRISSYDAPASSPTALAVAKKVLNQQFGMSSFRLKQEAVITRLLDGGSSTVVFPTGEPSGIRFAPRC